VLLNAYPNSPLPSKLSPRYLGPFEVIQQKKNDVECRNLIQGNISIFHVERLKIFHGTREEAVELAKIDNDQFEIDIFLAYRGDPLTRTTVSFEVRFQDKSRHWLPWSFDLFQTIQYENYCRSKTELFPLLYPLEQSKMRIQELNKSVIELVAPGDTVYVDLRCYGSTWYNDLKLPDSDHLTYVVQYFYTGWKNRVHRKIDARCDVFSESWTVDNMFVFSWGSVKVFNSDNMILIDRKFTKKYPQVLPTKSN
jgi:hypothetical protein